MSCQFGLKVSDSLTDRQRQNLIPEMLTRSDEFTDEGRGVGMVTV